MSIRAISAPLMKHINNLPKGALQSYHIEHGCCEDSPCLWVCLNDGWEFEDMGCGSLHESSVRSAKSVLASIRKVEE